MGLGAFQPGKLTLLFCTLCPGFCHLHSYSIFVTFNVSGPWPWSYFVQDPFLTGKYLLSSSHSLIPFPLLPSPQQQICIRRAIFAWSTQTAYAPALSGIASVTQWARVSHQTLNQSKKSTWPVTSQSKSNLNGLDRMSPMKPISLRRNVL